MLSCGICLLQVGFYHLAHLGRMRPRPADILRVISFGMSQECQKRSELASEASGCRRAILRPSAIFLTFLIHKKTAILGLVTAFLGEVMRRDASLVALVSLFFSAVALSVHADNRLISLPVQPISLTLEPRLSKEVIDLSGNWHGYASVGRTRVNYDWQISQQGQKVFGTISISTLDGLDQSTHAFEGTIQDSVVVALSHTVAQSSAQRLVFAAGSSNWTRRQRLLCLKVLGVRTPSRAAARRAHMAECN